MRNVYEQMEDYGAREQIETFKQLICMDYRSKVSHAFERAKTFVKECYENGVEYHVSVGGLDSITLLIFFKGDRNISGGYICFIAGGQEHSENPQTARRHKFAVRKASERKTGK